MIIARSYRPLDGAHNVADILRIVLVIAGVILLCVIGRVVSEGLRYGEMDRWQVCRFLSLGIFDISTSLGSAERFGVALNWHVIANLIALIVGWAGVGGNRHEQRAHTTGGHR